MNVVKNCRYRMILYFLILNLFDVISTHLSLTLTNASEGHPLYAYFYVEYGFYIFALVKITLAGVVTYFVLTKVRVPLITLSNVLLTLIVCNNVLLLYGDPVSWAIYKLSMYVQ